MLVLHDHGTCQLALYYLFHSQPHSDPAALGNTWKQVMILLTWLSYSKTWETSLQPRRKLSFSLFLSPSLNVPSHVKGPPFSLCSLCSFVLSRSKPPRILWYADTQEFLGLKMIDQTCQPWLLLLKMAALAVCALVIGSHQSYSSCDWSKSVYPQFMCCWQK